MCYTISKINDKAQKGSLLMKTDFNNDSPRSFEALFDDALEKSLVCSMIRQPAVAVYRRFNEAIDTYVDAFRKKYSSLQEYFDEQEKSLKRLLKQKGINQTNAVLDLEEGLQKKIAELNTQIYQGGYFNRNDFADLLVVKIPSAYSQIRERVSDMVDAPSTTISSPDTPRI